ncbi:WXG100 family type VII secretion target [Nocardia tengchongensis]|uniref:WXG100 family type VII secretion target n=1 Tax=Nocardia tengchongensis TaxID=2055889 RepID=UPI00369DB3C9
MSQISVKFDHVDGHTDNLGTIINGMEDNYLHLKALQANLASISTGATQDGYNAVMTQFGSKLDAYNNCLTSLKAVIASTAGSQGLMQITDRNGGNRFHGLV